MSKQVIAPIPTTRELNEQIAQMPNIRVFYHKKGRAKYISHLDITRCMQRALKRADLPVWYTQGFNPHMYMTFALPLALGYESECEAMDLRLTVPMDFTELKDRLNAALPRDIRVSRVALQEMKPQQIAKARYEVTFLTQNPGQLSQSFDQLCAKEEIIVMKHSKKGAKPVDIKPEFAIEGKSLSTDSVTYTILTTAGQKNINPTLLTDLFLEGQADADVIVQVLRKQIYTEDGREFA